MSETFLAELRRRGIPHTAGQCLVDAHADQAPRILEIIRKLELPLVLIFNGGRVMTLPQGVSKATGLQIALETLRLSLRNALAIGDRENDHELLRLAEVGVAVAWGSAALRQTADIMLDLDANGYIVVTCCASRLPGELLAASDVMIVTCQSNPVEVEALCRCCAKCEGGDPARWSLLGRLTVGQAVALPITEEAGGDLRLFNIGPRVTPHVRHREKYVDVPVTDAKAFVFGAARRARTVRPRG